jgi:hypothetical protein
LLQRFDLFKSIRSLADCSALNRASHLRIWTSADRPNT